IWNVLKYRSRVKLGLPKFQHNYPASPCRVTGVCSQLRDIRYFLLPRQRAMYRNVPNLRRALGMATANGRNLTIIDIALAAGVSKSTVSLVLKGSPLVRDETRERVTKTMETLGYVYNRGAANLRQAHSSIVGMVINDLSNPFYAEFAIGIERALQNS